MLVFQLLEISFLYNVPRLYDCIAGRLKCADKKMEKLRVVIIALFDVSKADFEPDFPDFAIIPFRN